MTRRVFLAGSAELVVCICGQESGGGKVETLDKGAGRIGAPEWYFKPRAGALSRKKEDKASLSGVFDRFTKFALANPNNKDRTVGVFVHGNGYRQLLSENSLNEIIDQQSSVLMQVGSHLQVFLRPCQGKQEMVCVRSHLSLKTATERRERRRRANRMRLISTHHPIWARRRHYAMRK